ncbi:MAG: insulinase family protein [Ignavibacteriales bacterium]|nr:insulinase family protein [Ignavibacteriales bacterium]
MPQELQHTQLKNGVHVVTELIPHIQSFSLGFWLNVGTRDEKYIDNGISHFIEHMLFKGTKKRSARKISETIEAFGGYLNAFTSKENTCYYGRGLSQHLPKTYDVIADMILNPLFKGTDIKKEASVIIDELCDIEDNPEELIFDKFEEVIFKGNSLAQPIIGREESIKKFNTERIAEFHKKYYGSNNLMISASGNIAHAEVVTLTEKYFSGHGKSRLTKRKFVEKQIPEELLVKKDISQVHCILGTSSYGYRDEERIILNLLSVLLGEGSASRLYQAVREREGITYQINSFVNSYYDASAFGVYFSTNEKSIDKALSIIKLELKKLCEQKIGNKELSRIKEYLKGSILLGMENTTNRMIRVANSMMYYNRFVRVDEVIEKIDNVTAEQIMAVAQETLRDEVLTKVILRAESKKKKSAA